jgi:hypothetical protein
MIDGALKPPVAAEEVAAAVLVGAAHHPAHIASL